MVKTPRSVQKGSNGLWKLNAMVDDRAKYEKRILEAKLGKEHLKIEVWWQWMEDEESNICNRLLNSV